MISAIYKPGVVKNPVVLNPVSIEDSKSEKCKGVVLKNKQITTSDKKKAELEEMLADNDFVNTVLKQYEEWKLIVKKQRGFTILNYEFTKNI